MSAQWYGGSANGRYITADSLGLRVLTGSHRHSPVPAGARGYSRVLTGSHRHSPVPTGTHGYSRVLTGSHRHSPVPAGARGYSRVLTGSHRHSPVPTGTHGYSRVLKGAWYTHLPAARPHSALACRPPAPAPSRTQWPQLFVGWVRSAPVVCHCRSNGATVPQSRPANTLY